MPDRLLDHLGVWARGASDANRDRRRGRGDRGGARARRRLGALAGSALARGRGRDRLALAGAWGASRRVLSSGLAAARALQSESAEAYFLHQLGSFALCLGESEDAISQLSERFRSASAWATAKAPS